MKVSEITHELLANYLKLVFADLTTAEKAELTALLATTKAYIRAYTGVQDKTVTGEIFGTGDGETTEFSVKYPVIGTAAVYIDGASTTALTFNAPTDIVFTSAPADGVELTATYTTGLDAYEDFVIAVYVLCQDMYDNRMMYVDKSNVNKVVETMLGMHCTNLL